MEFKLQTLVDSVIIDNEQKALYIGNFLDELKYLDIEQVFEHEPDFKQLNEVDKVYIVAMSHKLLNDSSLVVPGWIKKKEYVLDEPYFFLKTEGKMKLYLLMESPIEFKMRKLFVSSNVLERV